MNTQELSALEVLAQVEISRAENAEDLRASTTLLKLETALLRRGALEEGYALSTQELSALTTLVSATHLLATLSRDPSVLTGNRCIAKLEGELIRRGII